MRNVSEDASTRYMAGFHDWHAYLMQFITLLSKLAYVRVRCHRTAHAYTEWYAHEQSANVLSVLSLLNDPLARSNLPLLSTAATALSTKWPLSNFLEFTLNIDLHFVGHYM